ncbi:MAG: hypothetical protein WDO24_01240 [Pseudomonadota bacterium]
MAAAYRVAISLNLARAANWRFQATRDPANLDRFRSDMANAVTALEALAGALDHDPALQSSAAAIAPELAAYAKMFDETAASIKQANDLYLGIMARRHPEMANLLTEARNSLLVDFERVRDSALANMSHAVTLLEIMGGVSTVLGILLAVLIGRQHRPAAEGDDRFDDQAGVRQDG